MMVRKGFTLIEVLLATAIAAGISASLIVFWNLMTQSQVRVDKFTDLYTRVALMHHQIDRDLSGACIPLDIELTTTVQQQQAQPQKEAVQHVFEGDHTLQLLTCITNNPMESYWSELAGKGQPYLVRVVYKLVPETKRPNSFILMRQEGNDIALDPYQAQDSKIRGYELARGVKQVSIEYSAMVEQKQKQQTGQKKSLSQEPVFDRVTKQEWKQSAATEQEEKKLPPIPHWVVMHVELWDTSYAHAHPFTFVFEILPSLNASLKPIPKRVESTQSKQKTLTERLKTTGAQSAPMPTIPRRPGAQVQRGGATTQRRYYQRRTPFQVVKR